MTEHLTDATIRKLDPPEKGNIRVHDDSVPGFGIRITAGGAKSFIFNYRVRSTGQERRYTIGSFPNWQTTAARQKARELKRLVEDGGDPLSDLEAERDAPTVTDLIERFRTEHLPKRRPGTRLGYEGMLRKHIAPFFGQHKKIRDITHEDIDGLHRKITKSAGPYAANRTVGVLSKMFSLAVRWRMRGDNPCKGVERNLEYHRQRYLSGAELARLVAALAEHSEKQAANIFRVLLFTGARKSEVLAMRWADVDLTAGVWSKPASSTKQKRPHEAVLSAPVRQLLAEIAEEQTGGKHRAALGEYVFPSAISETGHVADIDESWWSICKAAKIDDLHIHDLRHSYASQLASGGASLPLIGAMLGHTKAETTKRYAHLFAEPQREAAEWVGAIYAAAGKPPKEPVPLKRGR